MSPEKFISLFVLLAPSIRAQERAVAIKAGRIIDGTGREPMCNEIVVVSGQRISAVGPQSSVPIPFGAEAVDLSMRWF